MRRGCSFGSKMNHYALFQSGPDDQPVGTSKKQGRNELFGAAGTTANFFIAAGKILTILRATGKTLAIFRHQRQNFNVFSALQTNLKPFFSATGKFFAVFRFKPFGPHFSVNFQPFGPHLGLFNISKQIFIKQVQPTRTDLGRFGLRVGPDLPWAIWAIWPRAPPSSTCKGGLPAA